MKIWDEPWIMIELEINNKTTIKSISASHVTEINTDAKLGGGGKYTRSNTLFFADGSSFEIPEDAKIVAAPWWYAELMEQVAKRIKV